MCKSCLVGNATLHIAVCGPGAGGQRECRRKLCPTDRSGLVLTRDAHNLWTKGTASSIRNIRAPRPRSSAELRTSGAGRPTSAAIHRSGSGTHNGFLGSPTMYSVSCSCPDARTSHGALTIYSHLQARMIRCSGSPLIINHHAFTAIP